MTFWRGFDFFVVVVEVIDSSAAAFAAILCDNAEPYLFFDNDDGLKSVEAVVGSKWKLRRERENDVVVGNKKVDLDVVRRKAQ